MVPNKIPNKKLNQSRSFLIITLIAFCHQV